MAWLKFNRTARTIELYSGSNTGAKETPAGSWEAHNDVASTAKATWPDGTYKWTHYNVHSEVGIGPACLVTAYGCSGIHVFDVPERSGMGVHAGRMNIKSTTSPLGKVTLGCVRVVEDAMTAINSMHNNDPIQSIVIE